MSGPSTRSAPPIMTTSRNRIDWKNGKDSGLMKSLMAAKTPPARPATAADMANATVRISVGSRPIDWLATSESRTARMALPHGLASSRA